MRKTPKIFLLIATLLLTQTAIIPTTYADPLPLVVNSLDDTTDLSCDQPTEEDPTLDCTLREALTQIPLDGSTVTFAEGLTGTITLESVININPGGSSSKTITGNPNITVTGTGTLFGLDGSNITLQNMNIVMSSTTGGGVIGIGGISPSNIIIRNNSIVREGPTEGFCDSENSDRAILGSSFSDVEIIENEISYFSNPIYLDDPTGSYEIRDNIIHEACSGTGLRVEGPGVIDGNYIEASKTASVESGIIEISNENSSTATINIRNNQIVSTDTESDIYTMPSGIAITDNVGGFTITVDNNLIYPYSDSRYIKRGIWLNGSAINNLTVTNNIFKDNLEYSIAYYDAGGSLTNSTFDHNTFYNSTLNEEAEAQNQAFRFSSAIMEQPLSFTNIGFTNNIISNRPVAFDITPIDGTYVDNNLYYNVTDPDGMSDFNVMNGAVVANPMFIDPNNSNIRTVNFTLLDISPAIEAGTESSDIGAVDFEGTKRTTIYVDDDGVVDYSTVDFNTIQEAIDTAGPTGYTIEIAAGTYNESVSIDSKTLTITKKEGDAAPVINAGAAATGLSLINSDNSNISNLTITNTTTGEALYVVSLHHYIYNTNEYMGGEDDRDVMFAVGKSNPPDLEGDDQDLISIYEGNETLSAEEAERNWHLALVSGPGMYLAIYFNNDDYPNQTAAQNYLNEIGEMMEATFTIDVWAPNTFIYSEINGTLTYIPVTTPGVTTVSDEDVTIQTAIDPSGALYLSNSSSNTISDLTLSDNGVGIYFTGDSLTNTVLNIIFSNSSVCDIYSNATGDNTVNGDTVGGTGCAGASEPEPAGDVTAPVGLTALTSASRTTSSVSLSWSQVVEENFNHYEVWYGTNATDVANRNGTATEWDADNDANLSTISTTSTTVTGLSSATQYYFKVWAVDDSNNEETVAALSVTTSTTSNSGSGGGNNVIIEITPPESDDTDNTSFTDTVQEILDDATDNALEEVAEERETLNELIENAAPVTEEEAPAEIAKAFDLPITSISEDIIEIALEVLDNNADTDGDGITNLEEILKGQDPYTAEDSDNDGIPDFADPNPIKAEDFEAPLLIANPDTFVFGDKESTDDTPLTLTTGRMEMALVSDQGIVLTGIAKPNEEITITTKTADGQTMTIKTRADKNGRYIVAKELSDLNITANSILTIQAQNEKGDKKSMLAKVDTETIEQPKVTFVGANVKAVSELDSKTVQGVIAGTVEMPKLWTDIVTERVQEYIATTEYNKYFTEVVAAAKDKALGENKMIVQGRAKPGSTVIVAFKSVTYSSVVIADKNGYFETEVPQELADELNAKKNATDDLHQFIAFSVDYKQSKVSPFVQGLFKIYK